MFIAGTQKGWHLWAVPVDVSSFVMLHSSTGLESALVSIESTLLPNALVGREGEVTYSCVYCREQWRKAPHSEKGQMTRPDAWQAAASEHRSDWEAP